MADENARLSTTRLILVPALITLAVTIIRLVGELQHWPTPWFSNAAGGGGAVVGISWLPIIFGPYFALKLVGAGSGPSGAGKAIAWSFLGLAVLVLGIYLLGKTLEHPSALTLVGFLVTLAAAFVARVGWRSLGNTLIAYAFAARVPVVVVMFLAMRGNGGQGWGTHYDAVPPEATQMGFWKKFIEFAFLPQMFGWIGYTVIVGSVLGTIVVAIFRRKRAVPAAA